MPRLSALTFAALVAAATAGSLRPTNAEAPIAPTTTKAASPLPGLPPQSPRTSNYTIEARLDEAKHTIDGKLVLEWTNTTGEALSRFPFHLYWNAFRNNLSTSARGEGRRSARFGDPPEARAFGYTQVRSIRLVGTESEDLTPTIRYVDPDDGNPDDRTLMEVGSTAAVAPGATVRFAIEWTSLIPHGGGVGRAGWVHDYNFIVQWFPKIAGRYKGHWNAHTFHPWTEFFSDFGVYDVQLTLPKGFVVGATGRLTGTKGNPDGTDTLRFVQEDVHDFAWTASRRYVERKVLFEDAGFPQVDVRLLVQPEHTPLADRYLEAAKIMLRAYGYGSAPYPYPQLTVIDPAWNSSSGGMEYPTLFTAGTNVWAPPALREPEGLTIHEGGHQFWYGLVANNEFEEAWLDEGLNSYFENKTVFEQLGPSGFGHRYFGPEGGRGSRSGWPVLAPRVWIGRGKANLNDLRAAGKSDVMTRRPWDYRSVESYTLNSYGKPALTFQTLESLLGQETMREVFRVYARRFRFAHPTTEDLIATVNEVTGKDYRWFFDETFFSSNLCDYAIEVANREPRVLVGFTEGPGGLTYTQPRRSTKPPERFDAEVTVRRLGEVRLPVDVLVEFAGGTRKLETWDGQDRWVRFRYPGGPKVVHAVVDPDARIALDVNPSNNGWRDEQGLARRAATKWSMRFLFWLQNLLELHSVLG
jgi:Peptidase family M1 domain